MYLPELKLLNACSILFQLFIIFIICIFLANQIIQIFKFIIINLHHYFVNFCPKCCLLMQICFIYFIYFFSCISLIFWLSSTSLVFWLISYLSHQITRYQINFMHSSLLDTRRNFLVFSRYFYLANGSIFFFPK